MTEAFSLTPRQDEAMNVLIGPAAHIALGGGSRSGKTFLFLRAVIIRALKADESRHAVFRFRFNSVKASVVRDTLPKVMALCFPGVMDKSNLDKTDWFLTLPNKSEIWFGGLDDKDRTEKILGMEFATIFFNECSQIPFGSVVTALTRLAQKTGLKLKAYYDLNPPSKSHWSFLRFIKKLDPTTGKAMDDPNNYDYFKINPEDNKENLAPEYLKSLYDLPERARKRFLDGEYSDDDENALWTDELIANNRILGRVDEPLPDFSRIVVAVDPSGCRGELDYRSDEIGIVVNALGTDGHAYLLEDLSGRYGPKEWGVIAVEAYHRHGADRIVGEVNYGGAMVEANIRAADENVSYMEVRATRGKVVRAEPISALYEQGKVHHVGHFPEIESQLVAMSTDGYHGLRSPDRADAHIWALTELFPGITRKAANDSGSWESDSKSWMAA